MAALFDQRTVSRCSSILRYNVTTYIDLYKIFVNNNYPLIYNYFSKQNVEPDAQSFDFLLQLTIEAEKLNNLIKIHSNSFDGIDDWELIDFIEDIKIKIDTINNTSKWSRSAKSPNSWQQSSSIQSKAQLKKNQTIEDLTLSVYNDPDAQNSWINISIQNNLFEGDYSIFGGKILNIVQQMGSMPNLFLSSVVDNLAGEKLYGLDFDKKINWINNDLSILSHIDTVKQSVNILLGLKKGEIPEFPNMGIDQNLLAGSDVGSLFYVSIIRQLTALFQSDDSLRNFNVTNFRYYNGKMFINFNIDTMYNFVYNNSQALTTE